MKKSLSFLLITFAVGWLIGCQDFSQISPPNPIVGKWRLFAWRAYNVPAWYAAKTNDTFRFGGRDTIFAGPSPTMFNVTSFTFSPDGSFAESYVQNPGYFGPLNYIYQVDRGKWTLADSVVSLEVANNHPIKLTYRAATNQLITDIFPKTSVVRLSDGSVNTVSYSMQIYYLRSP